VHRSGTIWLIAGVLGATGCYRSHELPGAPPTRADGGVRDGSAPTDAFRPDARVDGGSPETCDSLALGVPIPLSAAPPPDQHPTGLVAIGDRAYVAFASSNDVLEWDRPHRVRALAADATPLGPARVAFPEPDGWYYSGQPNLAVAGDGAAALAFSAGRGCEMVRLAADGTPGPRERLSGEPCWGPWEDDGGVLHLIVERIDGGGARLVELRFRHGDSILSGAPPPGLERIGRIAFADVRGPGAVLLAQARDGVLAAGVYADGRWDRATELEVGDVRRVAMRRSPAGAVLGWLTDGGVWMARLGERGELVGEARGPFAESAPGPRSGLLAMSLVGDDVVLLHVAEEGRATELRMTRVRPEGEPESVTIHRGAFIADVHIASVEEGAVVAWGQLVESVGHQVFAAPLRCGARRDPCAAQQVVVSPCVACDDITGAYWDGHECRPLSCNCNGPDCERTYPSIEACRDAHGSCAPERCRDTEGRWLREPRYCVPTSCGRDPSDCDVGRPSCHCGPGRRWVAGEGCAAGTCEPADAQALCVNSGGRWDPVCCPSECGVPCGDDCTAMACTCPDTDVWDPQHGCVRSEACLDAPPIGAPCDPNRRDPCDPSSVCCEGLSGYRCLQPFCDEGHLGCY
jgi:hypothetical protein